LNGSNIVMKTLPFSDRTGLLYRHHTHTRSIAPRIVDIWCPPSYAHNQHTRYPVIYMHDGQNLFDPAFSYTKVDWGIDEAINRLIATHAIPGAIVVGIWNTAFRQREYIPARPFALPEHAPALAQFCELANGTPLADEYLGFLTQELKPMIDSTYRTLADREHTFVMGSSRGGLISLYALIEYPHVFAGAGCLSTHWPAGGNMLVDWCGNNLPAAGQHRLYFDYGTETLDATYEPYQQRMDLLVQRAGYRQGRDWLTKKFPGAEHTERAWRDRVDLPLSFLLGCNSSGNV
jgi:predicted alpha/beta superfamily hydrolase